MYSSLYFASYVFFSSAFSVYTNASNPDREAIGLKAITDAFIQATPGVSIGEQESFIKYLQSLLEQQI